MVNAINDRSDDFIRDIAAEARILCAPSKVVCEVTTFQTELNKLRAVLMVSEKKPPTTMFERITDRITIPPAAGGVIFRLSSLTSTFAPADVLSLEVYDPTFRRQGEALADYVMKIRTVSVEIVSANPIDRAKLPSGISSQFF